ncbi:MAG: glycerol-3-phosphate 1-O-acyltransferase PlsY [Deltaproteobacteria bacterium]|nr:glycerol-3-phosphate 1-O-acyltransferase PlsY [Deltaproteobacteria bacterium]
MIILRIFFLILSYIIGAIPFGQIISRNIAGIDITLKGSGNIGATNVAREIGIKWGLLTLLLDLFKGFFPVFITKNYITDVESLYLALISLAVLLGHRFSPFLNFSGGKGVAAAFGVFLALSPVSSIVSLCAFIIAVYFSNYISLGSITGAFIMPLTLSLLNKPASLIITAFFTAVLILITHSGNITRIIRGEERKWRNTNHDRTSSNRSNSSLE